MLLEDSEEELLKKHQDLCNKLGLDVDTTKQAWNSFLDIKSSYTIEGDPVHWLGCAVFVTCMTTESRITIESNCVSLTSLLRYCSLSLTQFFNKITKWADMSKTTDEMCDKIKRLEGNFAVSYHVFKKFIPIFSEIFKGPVEVELMKQSRNRKQSISRAPPCTPTKVFEFCWILFITVKAEIPLCSEDIVESYHLLQACCDLAFKNAFLDERRDLLNPKFSELPPNWSESNYIVPTEAPCIIDYLCKYHNGISTEAKYVKEYCWKNLIKSLFAKKILNGNEESFAKLFDPENFEHNLKNITKTYEAHLLSKGELDERIFLGDTVLTESSFGLGVVSEVLSGTTQTSQDCGGTSPLPSKYANRLQALLAGRLPSPSELLIQIFNTCLHDPTERIKQVVESMSEQFCIEFTVQTSNFITFSIQFARQKLHLAKILFYRFVESIFGQERQQRRDISNLAQQEIFYQSLFACCLEIITYAHNCQRKFPWILNAVNIQPFYFVRVIELIVRLQDPLSRDVVKHLNMVQEKILETLMWKSESPIWKSLENSGEEFPKFEDIALPGKMMCGDKNVENSTPTKLNHDLLSPGPSAVDRFQSPISSSLNKHLKSAQSTIPTQFVMIEQVGVKQFLPVQDYQEPTIQGSDESQAALPAAATNKPKKTGGLSILLRKFYNLAYARMEHLCELLHINDLKLRQKIFTVFECSVREHTDLMRDRHLDQLLMCAVYVVCKVTDAKERKFAEIMEHYRIQPQAKSHVYRSVLIERCNARKEGNGTIESQGVSEGDKRGDLISFYNTVYIQVMRSFALQFSPNSSQNTNVKLSPLPLLVNNNLSPRFQISSNLFISSYDAPPNSITKGITLDYHFTRSPSKDLEKINSAINRIVVGKRILIDENEMQPPNKRVNRNMQSLLDDSRSHICE